MRLPHPEIFEALEEGASLLVNDGQIRLKVTRCDAESADCEVMVGGVISDRKGVNVPDVVLNIPALTEKDRKDLEFVCALGVDWLGMSFVQRPEDVAELSRLDALAHCDVAHNELDCPRLVAFIPVPKPQSSKVRAMFRAMKDVLSERYKMVFLDPVTGAAVPTGPNGDGYAVTLPTAWFKKNRHAIADGLRGKQEDFEALYKRNPADLSGLSLPPGCAGAAAAAEDTPSLATLAAPRCGGQEVVVHAARAQLARRRTRGPHHAASCWQETHETRAC